MRAPLVEAEQDGSIRIEDLTKVGMARRRLSPAEEQLVPFEASRHIAYADDRPCAFHRISVRIVRRVGRDGERHFERVHGLARQGRQT